MNDDELRDMAERHQLAMLRLGAADDDFVACGIEPPTVEQRKQARAEGWPA